jgi:hypothetical protein
MIAANPTRPLYPARREPRTEPRSARHPFSRPFTLLALTAVGVSLEGALTSNSVPISDRARSLPRPGRGVSVFGPLNVDALDAASSISPLFATLTENTGGGGGYPGRASNLFVFSPFNFKLPALFTLLAVSPERSLEGSGVEGSTTLHLSPLESALTKKPGREPLGMRHRASRAVCREPGAAL